MKDENKYRLGDLCTMIHSNGAGEGIIWVVVKVEGVWLRVAPAYVVTGPSVLNAKKVYHYSVKALSLLQLCELRRQFDEFIQGIVSQRSGETISIDAEKSTDEVKCTCPDWWFPGDHNRKEELRQLSHSRGCHHHVTCVQVAR